MARSSENAPEPFVHHDSYADRLLEWISVNLIGIVAIALGVLLLAGGYAGLREWRSSREETAASAFGAAQRAYLDAMGAPPGSFAFTEPANAETARKVRSEAIDRYLAVATQYPGRRAATFARIEAGNLYAQIAQPEKAIELWRAALEATASEPDLGALIQLRIAEAAEGLGRWKEAGDAYAAAADVASFPLRFLAMADAARSYAEAGDGERAFTFANRVQAEAPNLELPPHLTARLQEIRAGGQSQPTPAP